ncbi:MAG TPA: hypothetical protein VG123_26635 [Streptosporangiaceae bacterium]|jgi:hypothetical protein|nr:hypothetical protein [Streptosporangiaceae bacterium]
MIVILGLVVLVAALIAGVAGVLANGGHAHEVTHFAVFGYHVTGSTGTLFLYGIVVGALALAGLSVLLAGARRTSRRGRDARRGLAQSRRETAAVSADRDDLRGQRDTARAYTVHDEQQNFTDSTLGDDGTAANSTAANSTALNGTAPNSAASNGNAPNGTDPGLREPSLFARLFARRPAPPQAGPQPDALASQAPAAQPEPPADQAAAVPAGASAPAD